MIGGTSHVDIYEKSFQSLATMEKMKDSTDEAWRVRKVAGDEMGQVKVLF